MTSSSTDARKHSRNVCSFTGCGRSKATYPNLHFYSFPVNRPSICELWIQNCANEVLDTVDQKTLNKRVVCEKHFEEDCFLSALKTRLNACAVPTILSLQDGRSTEAAQDTPLARDLPPEQTPENIFKEADPLALPTMLEHPLVIEVDIHKLPGVPSTSAAEGHSRRALFLTPKNKKMKSVKGRKPTPRKIITPGKRKLQLQLQSAGKLKRNYQQKLKRLSSKPTTVTNDMIMAAVQTILPEKVANFVCMQLSHSDKKNRIWTESEKKQALAMRRDLIKPPLTADTGSAQEALIWNREYSDDSSSLIYPQDETVEVVDVLLCAFDEVLKKNIHVSMFKNSVMLKAKRRIFRMHPDWMKYNTECYKHRDFILNKILVAKIKRSLQAMSKDLRQPGGKYGGKWEKVMKLTNK